MIQLKEIRENPEKYINGSKNKFDSVDIKKLLDIDKKWRSLVQESEQKKNTRNNINYKIAELKKNQKKSD